MKVIELDLHGNLSLKELYDSYIEYTFKYYHDESKIKELPGYFLVSGDCDELNHEFVFYHLKENDFGTYLTGKKQLETCYIFKCIDKNIESVLDCDEEDIEKIKKLIYLQY